MRIRIPIHPIFLTNDNARKSAIEGEKPTIESEKSAIQHEKPEKEDEKLSFDIYTFVIGKQNYQKRTVENLNKLYHEISANQIFGAPEIKEILNCTATYSKDIMQKLRVMMLVKPITGYGKGKYRFCYSQEMDWLES